MPSSENPRPLRERVTLAVVTHDSAAVVADCLAPLAGELPVIVVDNASADGTLAVVRRAAPRAAIIANAVNQGFGRACNQALARAETEFLLLLNPDAAMEPAALMPLLAAADRWPEAAVLAPAIVDAGSGLIENHRWGLYDAARDRGPARASSQPAGPVCVGHLSGAAMLLRVAPVRAAGGFDPAIFLYYEDDDLCLRLRRAGHSLLLVPAARARHLGGASSPVSAAMSRRKHWHQAWSRLHLEAKHRGAGVARRLGLRAALRHAAKAAGHALVLNGTKARRDAARLAGTLAFLRGRPAVPQGAGEAYSRPAASCPPGVPPV